LLLAIGCGEPPAPPLAAVHGQVTFRGSPLPGGLVVFTPDGDFGAHGAQAEGAIGPDGRFHLTTAKAPGAPVGKHRVSIVGPDSWPLPAKFLDPQLSGLRAEVVAGQVNEFTFRLEDR
jgi:hypothetical protein